MTARATKLGAINETGIRMVSTTDPAEVLRLGASGAAMVLEADHAVLRLQDEETGRYVIRSYFGSADGRLQERLFRFDKQVSVDAIKRRAAVLVRDARDQPALDPADSGVKSLLAAPLKRDGRVIGTLTLYDKVAPDRFATGYFEKDDLELFTKFVSYLERAIANALLHAHTRQFRNFDEETGVPNAGYLAKRIDEEIARGNNRDGALAIAICTLENLADVEAAGDSAKARRVVQCTVDALRANARDFDVIGRTGAAELAILLVSYALFLYYFSASHPVRYYDENHYLSLAKLLWEQGPQVQTELHAQRTYLYPLLLSWLLPITGWDPPGLKTIVATVQYGVLVATVIYLAAGLSQRDVPRVSLARRAVLVVGGERHGIPPELLERCDSVLRLPMAGFVPSYNLQAAMAMVVGERRRQRSLRDGSAAD